MVTDSPTLRPVTAEVRMVTVVPDSLAPLVLALVVVALIVVPTVMATVVWLLKPSLKVPVVPVVIGLLNVTVWTGASTDRSMGMPLAELLATLMFGTLAVPWPEAARPEVGS